MFFSRQASSLSRNSMPFASMKPGGILLAPRTYFPVSSLLPAIPIEISFAYQGIGSCVIALISLPKHLGEQGAAANEFTDSLKMLASATFCLLTVPLRSSTRIKRLSAGLNVTRPTMSCTALSRKHWVQFKNVSGSGNAILYSQTASTNLCQLQSNPKQYGIKGLDLRPLEGLQLLVIRQSRSALPGKADRDQLTTSRPPKGLENKPLDQSLYNGQNN